MPTSIANSMKSLIDTSSFLYLLTLFMAFLVSWGLTPVCRWLAIKLNIMDNPHSEIKTHRVPTPYLGGLAIVAGWVISLFVIRYFTHFPTGTLRSLRGILVGSLIIFALGLADDVTPRGLGFKKKFMVQTLAAVVILFFGIQIHFVSPSFIAIAFTIIWVVGITNAFNIIDIMDGLSGGIAVIASLAFLFIALPSEMIYVNFCSVALAGACLGFLPFNFSKNKKIFMGDTGSLTIGFILSAVSVGTSYTKENYIGLFAPLLILAIPLYDTLLVMVLRWKRGQSPFLGSKDHFALRLEKMGYSRGRILTMTYASAIVLAVGAYSVTRLDASSALIVFGIIGCGALVVGYLLSKVKID
jgi:UDP-GlcNAc:undecaprenyl-phosphate GlcNAc-1-phosphate transferase